MYICQWNHQGLVSRCHFDRPNFAYKPRHLVGCER